MKGVGKAILAVIAVALLLEPLVEVINVMREKIVISSALWNACNAASQRSVVYEHLRDRNIEIDEELYKQYFSEAFEDAIDGRLVFSAGNTLRFSSYNDNFNEFEVYLDFKRKTDYRGLSVVEVTARAESIYKFKTKYLITANDFSNLEFSMVCERSMLLQVNN